MVRSRVFATAAESGLRDVAPNVAPVVHAALQHYMKGLLEEVIVASGAEYKKIGRFRCVPHLMLLPNSISSSLR